MWRSASFILEQRQLKMHQKHETGEDVPASVTADWLAQAEEAAIPLPSTNTNTNVSSTKEENESSVIEEFNKWRSKPELAEAVAAIKALTAVIKTTHATTMMQLEFQLKTASDTLKAWDNKSISLSAGCDLFMRYVTRTSALEYEDFDAGKSRLIERGERFGEISLKARKTIAMLGQDFVQDGSVIMVHGFSRVVLALLKMAASNGKFFSVVCTEGRPKNTGVEMSKELISVGIPVKLILDSAVAYMMEQIDMVMFGADGVVESGGIINMIGTYQIALVANSMKKPVYVAAESFKFARLYPLDQRDMSPVPSNVKFEISLPPSVEVECNSRDYTPPQYLTLLFTDLGVLTPSAVSDELIQLYL